MTEGSVVSVREIARAYTPGEFPPHIPGADVRKNERGYYIRLDLDGLPSGEASDLLSKARDNFDVEIAEQVLEDGRLAKERRYVDSVTDVPEQYAPERGPQGGIYYEVPSSTATGGMSDPDAGNAAESVGYSGEPVLAVHFDDVDEGDRVAFERDEEHDVGEVVAIDEEQHTVTVETGDGNISVLAETFDLEKAVSKDCDGHHKDGEQIRCDETGETFQPDAIEANNEICPACDEDVDVVGLMTKEGDGGGGGGDATLTTDTAGVHNERYSEDVELPDECRLCGENDHEEGSMLCAECADKGAVSKTGGDDHIYGPFTNGTSIRLEQGEAYCENEGEVFRTDKGDDVVTVCPVCEEGLGDHGEVPGPNGETGHLGKADASWVSFVGPKGGQGWVNMATGEKRYQKERPGPGPEDVAEEEFADGWTEPPADSDKLLPGQEVEFRNYNDEYVEGEYAGVNEQGYHAVETEDGEFPVGPDVANEITAVGAVGETHPDESGVSLDPDHADAEEWAREYEPGETVPLDTSQADVVDADAKEFEVMGYVNDEMTNQGWLAVEPTEEFLESKPDLTHIAVDKPQILSPEEYEEAVAEGSEGGEGDEPDKGQYVDVGADETLDLDELSSGMGVFFERYDGQILNGEIVGTESGISVEGEDGAVYPIPEDGEIQAIHESGAKAITDGSDEQ